MTFWKWSTTAATNATADSTINYAEGQAPSTLNDSARAAMAALAKYRDDIAGIIDTGGSSTAYTVTTYQNLTALTNGFQVAFQAHAANGASATLQVDSTSAKALRIASGTALPASVFYSGGVYRAVYDSGDDCYYVHGYFTPPAEPPAEIPSGTAMLFVQAAAPTGWTKSTSHNDKALRVVSGTGGGSGGGKDFSWLFSTSIYNVAAHTHTGSTSWSGDHQHTDTGTYVGGGSTSAAQWLNEYNPQHYTGWAGNHQHSFTTDWSGGSSSTTFAVKYVDVIRASKN